MILAVYTVQLRVPYEFVCIVSWCGAPHLCRATSTVRTRYQYSSKSIIFHQTRTHDPGGQPRVDGRPRPRGAVTRRLTHKQTGSQSPDRPSRSSCRGNAERIMYSNVVSIYLPWLAWYLVQYERCARRLRSLVAASGLRSRVGRGSRLCCAVCDAVEVGVLCVGPVCWSGPLPVSLNSMST